MPKKKYSIHVPSNSGWHFPTKDAADSQKLRKTQFSGGVSILAIMQLQSLTRTASSNNLEGAASRIRRDRDEVFVDLDDCKFCFPAEWFKFVKAVGHQEAPSALDRIGWTQTAVTLAWTKTFPCNVLTWLVLDSFYFEFQVGSGVRQMRLGL